VGNLALRALPFLYAAGRRLIADEHIDLVYFSTTAFFAMPLGRVWKREFGVSLVLDFQDPWLSDYYETHPDVPAPPKYGLARRAHTVLERWTLEKTDGIVSVSKDYIDTLRRRYSWISDRPSITLPFGASPADFDLLDDHPIANRFFSPGDGRRHGVYVGRGGGDMAVAVDIIFRAFASGLVSAPEVFEHVDLHFVGTDYASAGRSRKTIEPAAERAGVDGRVRESTARVPYFEALQLLRDADFLLVIGSDDAAYTPSKIYPYLFAGKPIVAVVHQHSAVVDVLRRADNCVIVTFGSTVDERARTSAAGRLADEWRQLLVRESWPHSDAAHLEPFTAREMARQQCALFDAVLDHRDRRSAVDVPTAASPHSSWTPGSPAI
jgi:glycosyltransferase involved in cell wall biosynthesis